MPIDWSSFEDSFDVFIEHPGTFVETRNSGSVVTPNVPAIRGSVDDKILQYTNGAVVRPEVLYQIKKKDYIGSEPKPGDLWIEGGITYTVQEVPWDDAFWLLAVFNPKVVHNLADSCNILTMVQSQTTARTRHVDSLTVTHANVDCSIRPTNSQWSVNHGKVGTREFYDVFFGQNYDIKPDVNLLTFTDPIAGGTITADIKDVNMQRRIDDVMVITCEARP